MPPVAKIFMPEALAAMPNINRINSCQVISLINTIFRNLQVADTVVPPTKLLSFVLKMYDKSRRDILAAF